MEARGSLPEALRYAASLLDRPLLGLLTLVPVAVVRSLSAASPGHDDPDLWWVAAAGRWTLAHGWEAPTRNLFSFVDGTQPWIMHEWLLGPLYARGLELLGPPFFALLALVAGVATATVALATIGRESRSSLAAWLPSVLLVTCFSDRFATARPTGVALLFPVVTLALVLRDRFRVVDAVASTLVMLVWTNAHGSFPLGFAILVLGAFREQARPLRLAAVAGGGLVTFVNPYGVALHRFVVNYLLGDEPLFALVHRRIAEFAPIWRAPDWVGPQVIAGLAGVLFLAVVGLRHEEARLRSLVVLGLLAVGVRNARHLELAGILSLMLLAPAANRVAASAGARVVVAVRWVRWVPLLGGMVGLAAWMAATAQHPRDDRILGAARPAARLAITLPDDAHVVAPFADASLVTWLDYPRGVLTLADSRNDCFRVSTLELFFDLETGRLPPDLGAVLRGLDATHALLPDGHPLRSAVAALPGWTETARDGAWSVLTFAPREADEHIPRR